MSDSAYFLFLLKCAALAGAITLTSAAVVRWIGGPFIPAFFAVLGLALYGWLLLFDPLGWKET